MIVKNFTTTDCIWPTRKIKAVPALELKQWNKIDSRGHRLQIKTRLMTSPLLIAEARCIYSPLWDSHYLL